MVTDFVVMVLSMWAELVSSKGDIVHTGTTVTEGTIVEGQNYRMKRAQDTSQVLFVRRILVEDSIETRCTW